MLFLPALLFSLFKETKEIVQCKIAHGIMPPAN